MNEFRKIMESLDTISEKKGKKGKRQYAKFEFENADTQRIIDLIDDANYGDGVQGAQEGMVLVGHVSPKEVKRIENLIWDNNGGMHVQVQLMDSDEADQYM